MLKTAQTLKRQFYTKEDHRTCEEMHADSTPRNHWLIDSTPLMSLLAVIMVAFTKLMLSLNDIASWLQANGWVS